MTGSSSKELPVVYIGLGANLGEPLRALRLAVQRIAQYALAQDVSCSSFYRTSPVDSSGPDYVNAVMKFRTALGPELLLKVLQKVENELGRVRPTGVHNAPRTMDCDLLMYADRAMASERLVLPHPRMHLRAFVLVPLLELDPRLRIPGIGSAEECLKHIHDQPVERLDSQIGEE